MVDKEIRRECSDGILREGFTRGGEMSGECEVTERETTKTSGEWREGVLSEVWL